MKYKVIAAVMILCCAAGCNKTENPVTPKVTPGSNHDPVILSVTTIPDSVEEGKSCLVEVLAADSDGDSLTYEYLTPGIISRSPSQPPSEAFYTPNSCCGQPQIIVTVKDDNGGRKDTMIVVPAKGDQ
jgi:hypothetical protein